MSCRPALATLAALALSACSAGDLPGLYYTVTLETAEDTCKVTSEAKKEVYTYRLVVEGAGVQVFIEDDLLATGALAGCDLSYGTAIFTDKRTDGDVRWTLHGDAVIAASDLCDAGEGWQGTETIDVIGSTDEDVPPSCAYTYDVTGTFDGEVE